MFFSYNFTVNVRFENAKKTIVYNITQFKNLDYNQNLVIIFQNL